MRWAREEEWPGSICRCRKDASPTVRPCRVWKLGESWHEVKWGETMEGQMPGVSMSQVLG